MYIGHIPAVKYHYRIRGLRCEGGGSPTTDLICPVARTVLCYAAPCCVRHAKQRSPPASLNSSGPEFSYQTSEPIYKQQGARDQSAPISRHTPQWIGAVGQHGKAQEILNMYVRKIQIGISPLLSVVGSGPGTRGPGDQGTPRPEEKALFFLLFRKEHVHQCKDLPTGSVMSLARDPARQHFSRRSI